MIAFFQFCKDKPGELKRSWKEGKRIAGLGEDEEIET